MHHQHRYPPRLIAVYFVIVLIFLMLAVAGRVRAQAAVVINVDALNGNDAADGSIAPVKTITRGLDLAKTTNGRGQAVVVSIAPGTYRESLNWRSTTETPVIIEAKTPHTVIVSGADVWTDWRTTGALLVHDWVDNWGLSPIPVNWVNNGLNVPITDIVRRREVVIVDGVRLRQVINVGGTGVDGTYFVDETANTLTINPPNNATVIEVGRRTRLLDMQGAKNVTVRGLIFEGSVMHFDQDAAYLNNLTNVLLENNVFRRNNGGGLFLGRSTNAVTRANLFTDNGTVGFTGAYNHDYLSEDDTATLNNWRGDLGGFITWHPAGVKHLHSRNARYTRLTTDDNLATGFWLDTDHEGTTVDTLKARRNKLHGLYLEASQGAITVNGGVIENNVQYGVYLSSVNAVTMTGNRITGNGVAGVFIGGNIPTRSTWNHVTDRQMELYPAKNITWSGNQFGGLRESAPALYYGTGQFNEQFKPTFKSGANYWWNADNSRPIRVGNNPATYYTLATWQQLTGQDMDSVQGQPSQPIPPSPTATATATATPTASATPTGVISTMTATQVQVSATPEMTLIRRIVAYYENGKWIIEEFVP